MEKRITGRILYFASLLPLLLMCLIFVPGCSKEEPQPTGKYVVFTNNYQEKIQLSSGSEWTVEYDYDNTKTYKFEYEVFYDDGTPTGESDESEWIRGDKPGTYKIYARYECGNSVQDCTLIIVIKDKALPTPEVRFDPNGATVEERDGETIYVYDYDGKDHFPLIELYHENKPMTLRLHEHGIVSVKRNGEYYKYFIPREAGIYTIEYWVYEDDYANVAYRNKFGGVKVTVTVEIRDSSTSAIAPKADAAGGEAQFGIDSVREECERLTETDALEKTELMPNGDKPTVQSYIKNVKHNTYTSSAESKQLHTRHIYAIIPKAFFQNEGDWYYCGKGYAFYVKTRKSSAGGASYLSDVVIIDNNCSFKDDISELDVNVRLFSRGYKSYCDGDGELISTEIRGDASREYYLGDVQFYTVIENEHARNCGDEGYSKRLDEGTIIAQTRLNYGGIYNRYSDFKPQGIVKDAVKVMYGYIPVIKDTDDFYGKMSVPAKAAQNWASNESAFSENIVTIENGNEKNIETFPSRQAQYDSDASGYVRSVTATFNEAGLMINDSAQMIALLGGSAPVSCFSGVKFHLFAHDEHNDSIVSESGENKPVTEAEYNLGEKYANYPLSGKTYENVYFDKTDYAAREGDNAGYIAARGGWQIFAFTPSRNGEFIFSVDSGKKLAVSDKTNFDGMSYADTKKCNLKTDKTYYIRVIGDSPNPALEFNLHIEFAPREIILGEITCTVRGYQLGYFTFIPETSGIYSMECVGQCSDIEMRVERVFTDSIVCSDTSPHTLDAYFYAGEKYRIVLYNGESFEQTVTLRFTPGKEITSEPQDDILNLTRIYTFKPEHNGYYTFTYSTSGNKFAKFSLHNWEFIELYDGNGGKSETFKCFYKGGETYYFTVTAYENNTDLNCYIAFTPPETSGKDIIFDHAEDCNIVKFTPQMSGKYSFTVSDTMCDAPQVYSESGGNVTDEGFAANQPYYIVLRNVASGNGRLQITLSCDRLYHNTPYTVKSGKNVLSFVAPVSGTYGFDGITSFTVYDCYYNKLYDQTYYRKEFDAGDMYYVYFESENASSAVSIYFDPVDLPLDGNIIMRGTKYYELKPEQALQITVKTKSNTGETVALELYDCNLNKLFAAENEFSDTFDAGRYFLRIETDDVDTLITVTSERGATE